MYQFSLKQLLVGVAGVALLVLFVIQFGSLVFLLIGDCFILYSIFRYFGKEDVTKRFAIIAGTLICPTLYVLFLLDGFGSLSDVAMFSLIFGALLVPVISVFGGLPVGRSVIISGTIFVYRLAALGVLSFIP